MKKRFLLTALIALLLLSLTLFASSCNSGDDSTEEAPTDATEVEQTEAQTEKSTTKKQNTKKENEYPSAMLDPATNILPAYPSNGFDQVAVDLGEGSYMNVAKKTSLEDYNAYKAILEEEGYTLYTTNVIGNNQFATYYSDKKIVNVMFLAYNFNLYSGNVSEFKGSYEVRVTVDSRDRFSLPALKEENVYEETYAPSFTLISDSDIIWPGRMGFVFQLSDGSFFIIDGGYTDGNNGSSGGINQLGISTGCKSSAPYLMKVLKEHAPDPDNIVISTWLITHMHEDHVGAFIDLALNADYAEDKNRLTIENVIYSTSSDKNLKKISMAQVYWTQAFQRALTDEGFGSQIQNKVKAHPGQQFFVRDITCTVYSSEDTLHCNTLDPFEDNKYVNNTSIVTKINFMGKDMLFLADSSAANNPGVLEPLYNVELKADVLQVAHHGYGDTSAGAIYKYVKPEIVIWPVYAQHFYGYEIGYMEREKEYGGVKNVGFNQILFEDGIRHYIHGSTNMTIKDFETWTPEPTDDPLQIYDKNTWVPDVNYIKDHEYK